MVKIILYGEERYGSIHCEKKKKSSKNKILIVIIFMFIIASGIILYKFYEKIDINETNQPPEAVRTLRTVEEEKRKIKKRLML